MQLIKPASRRAAQLNLIGSHKLTFLVLDFSKAGSFTPIYKVLFPPVQLNYKEETLTLFFKQ